MPYGETLSEQQNSTSYYSPFKFSAKEKDTETGYSYFGARYYSPELSVWLGVDPLSDEQPNLSGYHYCAGNPIMLTDPSGLYPKPIMQFDAKLGLHGGYKLNPATVHLLSLVSGVSPTMIRTSTIQMRAPGQYRPWYSTNNGGGAITMGVSSYGASITYTENWFEDDATKYNGNGYGQNIQGWLTHLAHEVGHLPQIDEAGGLPVYIGEFLIQYSMSGNHNGAPNEIEADQGSITFIRFNEFVNKTYGTNALINLMSATVESDGYFGTDGYKIKQIDIFWKAYQRTLNNE
jgi:RHS repeat-associated protein